jgi:hypothetical protein
MAEGDPLQIALLGPEKDLRAFAPLRERRLTFHHLSRRREGRKGYFQ